jgi:protein phosphatase
MIFFKPFIIAFGGNTGTVPVNDVWILNIEKAPFMWQKF